MRDASQNSAAESAYECFECGNVLLSETSPGKCPDCGGEMRNRHMPIE
ncbi:hypothetical protein C471_08770 [Halorubrum saccharovorum DSM 1137]|uniref:DUF7129 domain-containing protein n=1 Tax=Halorubrum saccharovorum DSM 1137 TaxID=1227484 RepID=M0DWH9_9EURY|nr:rubrerythrin-like domain-containing protein [Halorubrum saccharovorum]ELZ39052.1 hypothetical protein C471_08770 [Halorubrum saccharovorum DSM 1137]